MLEPDEGKLSSPVLRGPGRSNPTRLPDHFMSTKVSSPTSAELKAVLGSADDLWSGIVRVVEEMFSPLNSEWKPSKTEFGRMCLLQHKKRTLLYLTPEKEQVRVAIILGDRAYGLALASSLPAAIKKDVFGSEAVCRRSRNSLFSELAERHFNYQNVSEAKDHAQMRRPTKRCSEPGGACSLQRRLNYE